MVTIGGSSAKYQPSEMDDLKLLAKYFKSFSGFMVALTVLIPLSGIVIEEIVPPSVSARYFASIASFGSITFAFLVYRTRSAVAIQRYAIIAMCVGGALVLVY